RLLEPLELDQGISSRHEDRRIIWLDGLRLIQIRQRFGWQIELDEQVAAIVQRVGVIRLDLEHAIKACAGLIRSSKSGQNASAVVQREDAARIDRYCFSVNRHRFIQTALQSQDVP